MDGFDDLLNTSRAALEQNPFADNPFAHPSGASDPWASPFGASDSADAFGSTASHFASVDGFGSHSNVFESSYPTEPEVEPEREPEPETPAIDPLESVLHTAEDDVDHHSPEPSATSPGFRESVAAPTPSTTATPTLGLHHDPTIAAPSLEEFDKLIPTKFKESSSRIERSPSPPVAPYPREDIHQGPSTTIAREPHSPTSSLTGQTSRFKSPLDPVSPIEKSIAGLYLGGESTGGWQTETQTPWQTDSTPPTFVKSAAGAEEDDDSDDDKPILQTLQQKQKLRDDSSAKKDDNSIQPVFLISVDDPQKVGDPIRSYTMYTVHTKTTSPLYPKSSFSVLRRFSDFLWLYETLSNNNPGVVVPPVPEKNALGRFDDAFVKQRRLGLEKCIQKIANHPVLMKDTDLKFFLESDNFALDVKHRKAELAHEKGGLLASIGQTIAGPRFSETDEWFDRQKVYLDSLESQLRGLVRAIEMVAKHRQELSVVTGEFAQNVSELASSDVGHQLAQSLSGLADVELKSQDLQAIQSDQDMSTIMATADEYARLINSVRLAFASRIRVYHAWKNAEGDLLRTKQTHERHRAQGRIPPDRLGYSLSQVAESERRAAEAKFEYEHVSKLAKSEVNRFEMERIHDFKESLELFLEGMISRQKELIGAWENYQQMLLKKVGGTNGHSDD